MEIAFAEHPMCHPHLTGREGKNSREAEALEPRGKDGSFSSSSSTHYSLECIPHD